MPSMIQHIRVNLAMLSFMYRLDIRKLLITMKLY